ncbi:hypothetical protein AB4Z01_03095 [Inquilinus sp. YAF38]|uniref:hypothetical protein n=1 Tax=Inquilinus sp. YAF38 TaxID=3233084 RepID=UPI003F8FCF91
MKWTCLAFIGILALIPVVVYSQSYETTEYVGQITEDAGGQSVTLAIREQRDEDDSVNFRCMAPDLSMIVFFKFGRADSSRGTISAPIGYLTINQIREGVALTAEDGSSATILSPRHSKKLFESAKIGRPFKLERHDGAAQEYRLGAFSSAFRELEAQCGGLAN